jgi:hypothetical protein
MSNVTRPSRRHDEIQAAALCGETTAVALTCQRDLLSCVAAYPDLFPEKPFDAALYNAIALANAFGSPGLPGDRLRIANRATLWVFAVDWLIDCVMDSRDAVDGVISDSLRVADGVVTDSSLTRFLADIQAELASGAMFPATYRAMRSVWRDRLLRLLEASKREWEWKSAHSAGDASALPTINDYLDNADNFGSTFVNVSHWIFTGDTVTLDHLDELLVASDEVQRVLRLLNDLATYERDLKWGDLNVLMLGSNRGQVNELVDALIDNAREGLRPLMKRCPREAVYLERQIGYSLGFYGAGDYWGRL